MHYIKIREPSFEALLNKLISIFPRTADVTCTDSSSAAMARTLSASLVTPRGGDSGMVPTYTAPGRANSCVYGWEQNIFISMKNISNLTSTKVFLWSR